MDFTRDCRSRSSGTEKLRVLDADALGRLADVDQAVLVAVDQRPQQHAADDAEDRGVGADTQRQREDDGERQALGSGEGPKGELEVSQERHEPVVQPAARGPLLSVVDRTRMRDFDTGAEKKQARAVVGLRPCALRRQRERPAVSARGHGPAPGPQAARPFCLPLLRRRLHRPGEHRLRRHRAAARPRPQLGAIRVRGGPVLPGLLPVRDSRATSCWRRSARAAGSRES